MTNEQFENRMEFIVEQQAKFATDVQRLTDDVQQLTKAQERTDGMLRNLVEVNLSLTGHVQGLATHLQQVDERLNRLAEAQERSDGRLDTLIDVVDKLVRRNGGGNPGV